MATQKSFTQEQIIADLKSTGTAKIHGVGIFTAEAKAARQGRNPATGEAITIPAQTAVKFKVSKSLKDALNGK